MHTFVNYNCYEFWEKKLMWLKINVLFFFGGGAFFFFSFFFFFFLFFFFFFFFLIYFFLFVVITLCFLWFLLCTLHNYFILFSVQSHPAKKLCIYHYKYLLSELFPTATTELKVRIKSFSKWYNHVSHLIKYHWLSINTCLLRELNLISSGLFSHGH